MVVHHVNLSISTMPTPVVIDDAVIVAAVRERLRAGNAVVIRVWGRSMMPAVPPGSDLRFVPAAASDLRVGDVALVERGSGLFAHRVVWTEEGRIGTQGDAFTTADPPCCAESVLGVAEGVVLAGRQLSAPPGLATGANRLIGVTARALARARPRLRGAAITAWKGARALPGFVALRRLIQTYEIEPLGPRWAARSRTLVLAAGQRPTPEVLGFWAAAASREAEHAAWIAARGERAVGWLLARPCEGRVSFELWVDRAHRELGVGTSLLRAGLDAAEALGWGEVRVRARASTLEWFVARGFERTAHAPGVQELRWRPQPTDARGVHVTCG